MFLKAKSSQFFRGICQRYNTMPLITKEKILLGTIAGSYLGVLSYQYIHQNGRSSTFRKACSGSLATLAVFTISFPIDSFNLKFKAEEEKSYFKFAKRTYHELGMKFFLKGLQPMFYLSVFEGIFAYYLFEVLRAHLSDGISAGICALPVFTIFYPLGIIKCRMQSSPNKNVKFSEELRDYISSIRNSKSTYQKFDMAFKGVAPYALGQIIGLYAYYGSYLYFMHHLKNKYLKGRENLSILISSICSAILTVLLTNGLDTIAIRMQNKSEPTKLRLSDFSVNVLKRGISANLVYNILIAVLDFFVIEKTYKLFGEVFSRK